MKCPKCNTKVKSYAYYTEYQKEKEEMWLVKKYICDCGCHWEKIKLYTFRDKSTNILEENIFDGR